MNTNRPLPYAIIYRASMDHFEICRADTGSLPNVKILIITRDDVIKRHVNGVQIAPELFEAMRKVLAQVDAQQMRGEDIDLGKFPAGPMATSSSFTSTESAAYRRMFPFDPDRQAAQIAERTKAAERKVAGLEKQFEQKKRQRRRQRIVFSTMWLIAGVIGLFTWTDPCWRWYVSLWFVVGGIQNLISNIWLDRIYLGVKLEYWCMYGATLVLGPALIAQYVGVSNVGVGLGVLVLAIGIMHVIRKVLLPWRRRRRETVHV